MSSTLPQTLNSGRLKIPVSDKPRKKVELDNISIISDIPSEPGGASMSGTIRSYQTNLSAISEDSATSQISEPNNNITEPSLPEEPKPRTDNVRIEMHRFTVPSKKVSWNDSVIVTTTDSDNVMIAGLPYEPSDSSSVVSDSNSNGQSNSPTSTEAPVQLTNLHHRSASRVYNRRAPADSTPIVDEFELAQLGQILGSKPVVSQPHHPHRALPLGTPTPSVGTLTSSAGTLSLTEGPSYIGAYSGGSQGYTASPEVPVAHKRRGVSRTCWIAGAIIVVCLIGLLVLGSLLAIR
jgi:hypothetical protein